MITLINGGALCSAAFTRDAGYGTAVYDSGDGAGVPVLVMTGRKGSARAWSGVIRAFGAPGPQRFTRARVERE